MVGINSAKLEHEHCCTLAKRFGLTFLVANALCLFHNDSLRVTLIFIKVREISLIMTLKPRAIVHEIIRSKRDSLSLYGEPKWPSGQGLGR